MKKMIKENKIKSVLSSLIILLPMIMGTIFYNKIPNNVGFDNNIKNMKIYMVFILPVILLILHWICIAITSFDPKNKGQNKKIISIIFYILPCCSLIIFSMTYTHLLNKNINTIAIIEAICGVLLVFEGNYLPKTKQNSTIGIKTIWTLNNKENWNKTHRIGGKVWVVSGFVLMLSIALPEFLQLPVLIATLLVIILVPTIYSYCYYKKQAKNGTYKNKK